MSWEVGTVHLCTATPWWWRWRRLPSSPQGRRSGSSSLAGTAGWQICCSPSGPGRDAALDITVVNPCQAAFLTGAANTPGYALGQAHKRKMRGAKEACRAQGISFLPLVAESHGSWGEVAVATMDRIPRSLARQTGQREEEVM